MLFLIPGTAETYFLMHDFGLVPAAIDTAHIVRRVGPCATAQHPACARGWPRRVHLPPGGIVPIPVRHPLPHVARQVLRPAPTGSRWELPRRRGVGMSIVDHLVGMEQTIILQHMLLKGLFNVLFGMGGSLLIPPVIKKLKAYGVI